MFFSSGLILWTSLTFFFHLHIVMSSQAPTLLGIMTYPFFYLKSSFFTFLPFFSQITALLIFCLPITLLLVNSLIWSLMIAQQHSIKWGKWEDCTLLLLCLDSRSSRAPFAVALKKKKKVSEVDCTSCVYFRKQILVLENSFVYSLNTWSVKLFFREGKGKLVLMWF